MLNKKITACILAFILLFCGCINIYAADPMKGVWVSTVSNLDYPKEPTESSETLKAEAITILDNCKALGFNAVILQVRPASDAFYKSNIFPWSQWLTGSQGTAPDNGFDPLAFWVEEAHKRGMELHAWINPYRITTNGVPLASLADGNPAKQHPEYAVMYTNGNYYYDPAIPEVRQLLIDGLMEIVNNYNVDGIHMDDYFYPGSEFNDSRSYEAYSDGKQDIGDWRRNNVNMLIQGIRDAIDKSGKDVEFGISPCGIWANKSYSPLGSDTNGYQSYYDIYADTRKWALDNTIDYIAPQIYWEVGHKAADYATVANWWADTLKNSKTKLYIGIGDYRCDDAGSSSVWYNGAAIAKQLEYNKSLPKITGVIHFRYGSVVKNSQLSNIVKNDNTGVSVPQTIKEETVETTTSGVIREQTVATQIQEQTVAAKPSVIQEPVVSSKGDIKVLFNGKPIAFDQAPIIENDRTLVPMRAVFEALGTEVNWDGKNRRVTAKGGDTTVTMTIGSKTMSINSHALSLDVAPKIVNSRTLVPLRAVSEAFKADVKWDGATKTVTIEK